MAENDSSRPWVPQQVVNFYEEHAARYRQLAPREFESEIAKALAQHERFMDHECISLYAGTNVMNSRAACFLSASVSSRPSLGYPGDKYETGLRHAEQIEIMAAELLRRIFKCRYVEFRVGSGSLANLYAYMACTKPGDRIMAFPHPLRAMLHTRPKVLLDSMVWKSTPSPLTANVWR